MYMCTWRMYNIYIRLSEASCNEYTMLMNARPTFREEISKEHFASDIGMKAREASWYIVKLTGNLNLLSSLFLYLSLVAI